MAKNSVIELSQVDTVMAKNGLLYNVYIFDFQTKYGTLLFLRGFFSFKRWKGNCS